MKHRIIKKLTKRPVIYLIIIFIVIGVASLLLTKAAVPTASFQAETGARSGSVTIVDNVPAASGGSHVKFNRASSGSGTFSVVGGDIIGPDGKKFVPIGANVGARIKFDCYAFYYCNNSATGHADDALAWGWNMVRLNVVTDVPSDVTIQETIAGAIALIDEYTAKGIVVMPNSHSVTGTNTPMTDVKYQNINLFWDAILDRYKDNPYVWINYVNEPVTTPVKTGIDTNSEQSDNNSNFWVTLGNQQYQRVRQKTNNLFVYDLPIWGQQINELALTTTGEEFLQGKQNVVFSWHNYGGALKFDQGWAHGNYNDMTQWAQLVKNKNLPVLTGEFGRSSEANTPAWVHGNGNDVDVSADWTFDTWWNYGFGGLWWHGTGTPPNNWNLRMDNSAWYSNSAVPSASGERLKAIPGQKPAGY